MLTRVFDPLAHGDRSLDHTQGGLGIGLSLVKTLVELHGGSVTASSDELGKGSEFVVRIPCRPGRSRHREMENDTFEACTNGEPRSVLIVDDNQDAADSLLMLMKLRGYDARVAYDGTTAIDIALHDKPSVVLLDIGLPGMDGCEVCRQMRQRGLTDTRIIAMTGYGQDRDRERSLEAGFDLHTVKPVKINDLMRIIADA